MRLRTVLVFAAGLYLSCGPVVAKVQCPKNGQVYSFGGKVVRTGATDDGKPWYDVSASKCSGTDAFISVYPAQPVAACIAGAAAKARGTRNLICDEMGLGCSVHLTEADLTCK